MIAKIRKKSVRLSDRLGGLAVALGIVIFSLFPVYWVVTVSLTPESQDLSSIGRLFPNELTLDNYRNLPERIPFLHFFLNSLFVSVATTILSLLVATPAAYSLARFKFRGRKAFSLGILLLYMLPPIVLVVPLLVLYSRLNLYNTLGGLVLADATIGIPFATWLLMGFFSGIPRELEDSALVDGCTHFGAMRRILLPLSMPGLIAAGLIVFIFTWNEFLFGFTLTSGDDAKTLQVAMRAYAGGEAGIYWGTTMAAVAVTSIPVVALFLVFQRGLIGGLAEGGVKG